jgi:hypothetical protein
MRKWTSEWEGMNRRVEGVESRVRSSFQLAKNYAQEQAAKVNQQLQAEISNRAAGIEAKVSRLEEAQLEDRTRLAQLEQDADVFHQQIAEVRTEAGQSLQNLNEQVARNRSDLDRQNRQLERRRLDFEVNKGQTREVGPGITLTVSNTNVDYQRVEGRVHLVADGRILWVRDQSIQQPVVFYNQEDDRSYELVFTRVTGNGAVGYLLMPLWPSSEVAGKETSRTSHSASLVQ